jgi:hypothetical protein
VSVEGGKIGGRCGEGKKDGEEEERLGKRGGERREGEGGWGVEMGERGEGGGRREGRFFLGGGSTPDTSPVFALRVPHPVVCRQGVCVSVCLRARAREHGLVCVHVHICLYSYISAKSELHVWLPSSPLYA